ncbi:MAG TPA: hypothetical protein VD757_01850 [Candidatus Nitrosocosmicus sp.]|nr:hypothetical protein [Candidatus Nitrosocosmicus sp.]
MTRFIKLIFILGIITLTAVTACNYSPSSVRHESSAAPKIKYLEKNINVDNNKYDLYVVNEAAFTKGLISGNALSNTPLLIVLDNDTVNSELDKFIKTQEAFTYTVNPQSGLDHYGYLLTNGSTGISVYPWFKANTADKEKIASDALWFLKSKYEMNSLTADGEKDTDWDVNYSTFFNISCEDMLLCLYTSIYQYKHNPVKDSCLTAHELSSFIYMKDKEIAEYTLGLDFSQMDAKVLRFSPNDVDKSLEYSISLPWAENSTITNDILHQIDASGGIGKQELEWTFMPQRQKTSKLMRGTVVATAESNKPHYTGAIKFTSASMKRTGINPEECKTSIEITIRENEI